MYLKIRFSFNCIFLCETLEAAIFVERRPCPCCFESPKKKLVKKETTKTPKDFCYNTYIFGILTNIKV